MKFNSLLSLMKKFLVICLILLLVFLGAAFTGNLSTKTIYECSGKFATNLDKSVEATELAMRFTKYRSIVSLWSDSDGMIDTEFRGNSSGLSEVYTGIKIVGDYVRIWYGGNTTYNFTEIKGNFNLLSQVVELRTDRGVYNGECVETDR
jgi:hypothetical protein